LAFCSRAALPTWTADWCGADVTTLTNKVREHLKLGAVKDEIELLSFFSLELCGDQRINGGTGIALDGGQTRHAQRNHNVDAVRLFILTNSPTSRPFEGNGAGNGKSNLLIGVARQITPLNQIKQILAGLSLITNSLWIFDHRQTFAG
jgi:hypothetical protein